MAGKNIITDRRLRQKPMKISTRLFFTCGLVFIITGIIVITLVNFHLRQQALAEAELKARIILDSNLAIHTYFSHQLKPKLFKLTDSIAAEGYFEPVWMSSTYAVREIDKYFKTLNTQDYYYKEAAINARSPENEADLYEKAFLQELNANPELTRRSVVRILEGKPYFVTLRRGEKMEKSCLRCHSTPDRAPADLVRHYGPERSFNRNVGDIVSAISIRVPFSAAYARTQRFVYQLSGLLFILLSVLFAGQYYLSKRLMFKPLYVIRDKAIQISTSDERLGEEIPLPAGQELNELTAAFNSMSISLRNIMDTLEERIAERTAELAIANEQMKAEIEKRKRVEEIFKLEKNMAQMYLNIAGVMIVVLSADQKVVLINKKGCDVLGYEEKEILGKNWFDMFIPQRDRKQTKIVFKKVFVGEIETVGYYVNSVLAKNGEERMVAWHNTLFKDGENNIIGTLSSGEDITERIKAQNALKTSLKEKEVLLREIHHRVKNNMQVITSLLKLQSANIKHKPYSEMFKESRNRIKSMALVHERLYKSQELARIDFGRYVKDLVSGLYSSYGIETSGIKLELDLESVLLEPDSAITCGLIINELVSNSLKHAFADKRKGTIKIVLCSIDERSLELSVSDDGIGLPPQLDIRNAESLGLRLILMLSEDQLDGDIKLDRTGGTKFTVRFKRCNTRKMDQGRD